MWVAVCTLAYGLFASTTPFARSRACFAINVFEERERVRECVEEQNKNREAETNEGEMCLVGGETKTKTIF